MRPADAVQLRQSASPSLASASIDDCPAIARLSLKLASVPEAEFLTQYGLAAAEEMGADFFLIGRLNPFSNIMRSIRMVATGQISENITYSLDGTPCARALETGTCFHADNVADLFPRDALLKEMGIRGYVGAPLSVGSEIIGIVVGMTKTPLADETVARVIVERFRERVANAVQTTEILERYSWAVAEASDGIWDWDVLTGGTIISERIQKMLGFAQGEGPYDLMQIESAIHPGDKPRQIEAMHNHLNEGRPYDLTIRLRDRSGAYRWFRTRGKAIRDEKGKLVRMIGSFSDIHDLVIEAKRRQA